MSGFRSILAGGPAQGLLECSADWSWGSAFSMVPSQCCWQEVWASLHCPFVGLCECPGGRVAVSLRVSDQKESQEEATVSYFLALEIMCVVFGTCCHVIQGSLARCGQGLYRGWQPGGKKHGPPKGWPLWSVCISQFTAAFRVLGRWAFEQSL